MNIRTLARSEEVLIPDLVSFCVIHSAFSLLTWQFDRKGTLKLTSEVHTLTN